MQAGLEGFVSQISSQISELSICIQSQVGDLSSKVVALTAHVEELTQQIAAKDALIKAQDAKIASLREQLDNVTTIVAYKVGRALGIVALAAGTATYLVMPGKRERGVAGSAMRPGA